MKRNILATLLVLAAVAFACTPKEEAKFSDSRLVNDGSVVYNPTVKVQPFLLEGATKTVLSFDGNGANFKFVEGDVLGVFPYDPEQGDQVSFTATSVSTSSATFSGGGFYLKSGQLYAAYYPICQEGYGNVDEGVSSSSMMTQIPVDYTNQCQMSTDGESFDISSADYMVDNGIEPEGGACAFNMKHVGAIVVIDVTFGEAGVFTELSLNSDSVPFVQTGTLDITASPVVIAAEQTSPSATLALGAGDGLAVEAGQTVRFCMMVAPVDQSQSTLFLTLKDNDDALHGAAIKPKNFKAGYAYQYSCLLDGPAPTNLCTKGTANCYIVDTDNINIGGYYFDCTVAGNGYAVSNGYDIYYPASPMGTLETATGVEVVLNQDGCIYEDSASLENGKVTFRATGKKGNAKISVSNAQGIIWTWHIWCTDVPQTVNMNNYYDATDDPFAIMDRNLGATMVQPDGNLSDSDFHKLVGLYYQYGNPIGYTFEEFCNPYTPYSTDMKFSFTLPNRPVVANHLGSGNNILWWQWASSHTAYSVLWGEGIMDFIYRYNVQSLNKTLYDPCPPGYMVAPGIWPAYLTAATTGLSSDRYGIIVDNQDIADGQLYIPFNGFLFDGYHWKSGCSGYGADERPTFAFYWTAAHNSRNCAYGWHTDYNQAARTTVNRYTDANMGNGLVSFGYGVRCVVK